MSGPSRAVKAGAAGPGAKGIKVSDLDGLDPESTDFANYFCTYGYLYHQVSDILQPHSAPELVHAV